MNLKNNNFTNNSASLGGGAIYFNNKLTSCLNNTFKDNKALFANDFYTYPVRLRLIDNNGYDSLYNISLYHLSLVPGITFLNLTFEIMDYYNQTIKSLNGR